MSQSTRRSLKGSDVFLSKPQKKDSVEVQKNVTVVERKPDNKMAASGMKPLKAGFYLPEELIDKLDQVWFELRKEVGRKLNKSDIVRVALQEMINEYEDNKEKSRLLSQLS